MNTCKLLEVVGNIDQTNKGEVIKYFTNRSCPITNLEYNLIPQYIALEGSSIWIKYPTPLWNLTQRPELTQEWIIYHLPYEQARGIETGMLSKSLDYPTPSSHQPLFIQIKAILRTLCSNIELFISNSSNS